MRYKRSLVLGFSLVIAIFFIAILIFYLSLDTCPSGSFPCDGGTVCVPQRRMCDTHFDCRDKKDEDVSECGFTHGSKEMLGPSMVLVYQLAMNNQTERFLNTTAPSPVCRILSVPDDCGCLQGTRLYCIDKGLHAVPRALGATRLQLANNSIKLQKDSFSGHNLELLNLLGNSITEIPEGIFENQTKLQKLYLMNNLLGTINENQLRGLSSLQWLFLQHNALRDFRLSPDVTALKWLHLGYNQLQRIHPFPVLPQIYELFLDHNLIEEINDDTFANLSHLHLLKLSNNHILSITKNSFQNLTELRDLDLSENRLNTLSSNLMHPLQLLEKLSIGYNPLQVTRNMLTAHHTLKALRLDDIDATSIDFAVFDVMEKLKYVFFKKFYYCSMVPEISHCKPNSDGISSLKELVSRPVLRLSAWLVALLTLAGNLLVLWGRFLSRDENRALSLLIRNLAVADMLMGIYLLVIAIQDARFRHVYHQYSHQWTNSWTCTIIGAMAMTSSEVSLLILAFMSVERFLLIVDPMGGHPRLTPRVAKRILLMLWTVGITLAVLPIIHWRNSTRFYGTHSGMCFPLHLQEKYPLGWQYSAFIFLGVNMTGLIIIATAYCAMFISVWRTRRVAPCSTDCEFAIRFFFIVLTNAACWAPVVCLKIITFLDFEISSDVYAWLVVFIVPLNSAVNPLLYTFTTPKYRDQLLSFGWKYSAKRSSTGGDTESSRTSSHKNITCMVGPLRPAHPEPLISTIDTSYSLDCKL